MLALVLAAGVAQAQPSDADKAAADALFKQGKAAFDKGDFAEACAKLDASQKLEPKVGTLLFLGDCNERLGRKATAWASFLAAAELAGQLSDQRKQVAEVRAAALEPQVSRLTLNVLEPAESQVVRRSGLEVAPADWGKPQPLDAGSYKIEASAPGRKPWSSEVSVEDGGATLAVDVPKLEEPSVAPPPPPPDEPAAPAESGPSALMIAGIATAGVGLAGVVVGSVFGGLAKSKNDESLEVCRTETLCPQEGLDLREEAKDRATISTATFIPGAVLLAGGVGLVVVSIVTADEPEAASVRVETTGAGVRVRGAW